MVALENVIRDADEKVNFELVLGSTWERLLEAVVIAFLVKECRHGIEYRRITDEGKEGVVGRGGRECSAKFVEDGISCVTVTLLLSVARLPIRTLVLPLISIRVLGREGSQ